MLAPEPFFGSFSSASVCVLVFVFLSFQGGVKSTHHQFEACAPRDCGNSINISFPFRIDAQPSYCGYPGFDLQCKDGEPVLKMSEEDNSYRIRDIFYDNQTFLAVHEGSFASRGYCLRPLHNLTFPRIHAPFNVSSANTYLYFLYNCTGFPLPESKYFPVSCLSNGMNKSFAMMDYSGRRDMAHFSIGCDLSVVVPVAIGGRDLEESWAHSVEYTELLAKGFLAMWTANNCTRCRASGGRCGFNGTSQFVCFCPDRPHSVACKGRSNNKNVKKIAIGVSLGATAGFVVLFLILFFFFRKKRITSFSSDKPSRTISTDPYSQSELGKDVDTQLFSYKELEEATNNFDSSKELGDGGFGTVYQGKLKDGRAVAVKRLFENNYKRVEQFKNEIEILSRLRHPNLVTLYGCCSRHSRELLLVYEYVPNGTIADHLHGDFAKPGSLGWPTRLGIALETADALAYLHKVEIIHRDVKTNNILLDKSFHVKVADFGLSRLFPLDVTHISTAPQGTPGYVDPEYHRYYQLTYKSDVYSFGVVLVELISSMPAVDITRHQDEINLASLAINKIRSDSLDKLVDPTLGFNSDFAVRKMIASVAELAFRCLQEEKEARPTMEEVSEVLREIETQQYKEEIVEEAVTPADEDVLLKGRIPPSPDTVTAAWISRNTTPNTSG